MVLAILDGDHALYKVDKRLAERGIVSLLQPGLSRASLHDCPLGHIDEQQGHHLVDRGTSWSA
jgi:hypothetical protein